MRIAGNSHPRGGLAPLAVATLALALALVGCGGSPQKRHATADAAPLATATTPPPTLPPETPAPSPSRSTRSATATPRRVPPRPPAHRAPAVPAAGNPNGHAAVPAEARPVDTSHPTRVVGNGTPASCTSAAVVAAVAAGGVITFSCGPGPVTITLDRTARVRNDHGPRVVLDGGGKVTLSGGGRHRILYMNTCDPAQVFTTSHCQDQPYPQLTVENLTFADGNSTGETVDGGGGGAIFDRGGRLKVINSRFVRNRCERTGPDLGGAAIRALSQSQGLPVYVVGSTFGGAPGQGGVCSNGGALSSIGVSWVVLNSVMSYNTAVGSGANPARGGTPGGGSGGAIYLDGNTYTLRVAGSLITDNHANEGGGAVFFVSNDRTGTMTVEDSTLRHNVNAGFQTAGLPGIFFLGARAPTVLRTLLS